MKILVFGGSFDPPHLGHAALAAAAARAVDPDLLLIVPAWQNPLKSRRPAGAADRLAMARLGILDRLPSPWRARARLDSGELSGRGRYTVDTLTRLARRHPGAELHFATGWDAAAGFSRWKSPSRLRALATWWTARRPRCPGTPPKFFKRLSAAMPDASSSEARAVLAVGDDAGALLHRPVAAHIQKRRLYGLARLERLRRMLRPERFEHTRCVARLAAALARRWGEDEELALAAGLLHDCGRSIPVPAMASYARRRGLRVPRLAETARRQPLLLHAYISADVARRSLGESRRAVLSAVRRHTLGAARMSRLDALLYVADACSADRAYPGAAGLRRQAFGDLDAAYKACLRQKLRHCLDGEAWIHPRTVSAWNRLVG